jgi:hypothetical protein
MEKKMILRKLISSVLILAAVGPAGAGVARAADVSLEPYFEVATKPGEAFAASAPQLEPYFEVATESGEVFVAGAAQSEPYFDFGTAAEKTVATAEL